MDTEVDKKSSEVRELAESWQAFLKNSKLVPVSNASLITTNTKNNGPSIPNTSSSIIIGAAERGSASTNVSVVTNNERKKVMRSSESNNLNAQTARFIASHARYSSTTNSTTTGLISYASCKIALESAFNAARRVFLDLAIRPTIDEADIERDISDHRILRENIEKRKNKQNEENLLMLQKAKALTEDEVRKCKQDLQQLTKEHEYWADENERLGNEYQVLIHGENDSLNEADMLFYGADEEKNTIEDNNNNDTDTEENKLDQKVEKIKNSLQDTEEKCQQIAMKINEIQIKLAENNNNLYRTNDDNDELLLAEPDEVSNGNKRLGKRIQALPLDEKRSYLLRLSTAEFFARLGYIDVKSSKDRENINEIVKKVFLTNDKIGADKDRILLPEALSFIVASSLFSLRNRSDFEKLKRFADIEYGTNSYINFDSILQTLELGKQMTKTLYSETGGEKQNIRKRRLLSKKILNDEEKCTFKPEIMDPLKDKTFRSMLNANKEETKKLREGVLARQKQTFQVSTMEREKKRKEKQLKIKNEIENEETYTFQPKILNTSSRMNTNSYTVGRRNSDMNDFIYDYDNTSEGINIDVTNNSSLPTYLVDPNGHKKVNCQVGQERFEYLYQLALKRREDEKNANEKKNPEQISAREYEDAKECTYKPDICQSAKKVSCKSNVLESIIQQDRAAKEQQQISQIQGEKKSHPINSYDQAIRRMREAQRKREEQKNNYENLGKPKSERWLTTAQIEQLNTQKTIKASNMDNENDMDSNILANSNSGSMINKQAIPSPIQNATRNLEEKASNLSVPLLFIDIVVAPGKTGRIGVHEGDCVTKLAENFAKIYQLNNVLFEIVKRVISDNVRAYIPNKIVMVGEEMYIGDYKKKLQRNNSNKQSNSKLSSNVLTESDINKNSCEEQITDCIQPMLENNDIDDNEEPLDEHPLPVNVNRNVDFDDKDNTDAIFYDDVPQNEIHESHKDEEEVLQKVEPNIEDPENPEEEYEYVYEEVDQYVYEDENGNIVEIH